MEVEDELAARVEVEFADRAKADNRLAVLAEAETEHPARVDSSFEAVAMEAGTEAVELRFVEIGLVAPESIDLGFDSVVGVANGIVRLFEIVAEIAQVDAEVGPAAALVLVLETAEAP